MDDFQVTLADDEKKKPAKSKPFEHSKVDMIELPRSNALTEKTVRVVSHKVFSSKAFDAKFYDVLAALLGYKEKGSAEVLEYLSGNVLPGNLVVVTLRELSVKFNVSITWVARIFDRLQIDGFVAKKSQGIWTVSDEFLKLTKKPTNRTQFVIDIEEVPEQLEMFEKDGSINIDNIK
ncbi:TPA: hypothetical protein ACGO16_002004 [Streptococcus suis]